MFARSALFCAALTASSMAGAADSDIDTTFGIFNTGHNVIAINGGSYNGDIVADVLTASDGTLYLVGTSTTANGEYRITLVHLFANGQVDTNFGNNGRYIASTTGNTIAAAAAFDANDDIVVGGTRRIDANNSDFAVCKFHGAATLAFSGTGTPCLTVAFDLGGTLQDTARDVAVAKDGTIVLVGSANLGGGITKGAIAVLNPDGTPETAFGPGGKQTMLYGTHREEYLYGVDINQSNVVTAVGEVTYSGGDRGVAVERWYTGTGQQLGRYDSFLGTAAGPAYFRDVVRRGDDMIAVGGILVNGKVRGLVTKLTNGGPVDTTWANGTTYDEFYGGDEVEFTKVVEQSDGKPLVAGTMLASGGGSKSLIVARYRADGIRDLGSFNILSGYRPIDFQTPGSFDIAARLTLQNGRPVVAGSVQATSGGSDYDFGVARLQNDLLFCDSFGKTAQDN